MIDPKLGYNEEAFKRYYEDFSKYESHLIPKPPNLNEIRKRKPNLFRGEVIYLRLETMIFDPDDHQKMRKRLDLSLDPDYIAFLNSKIKKESD